ncbi:MAG: hypothetical protein V4606_00605 [Patescibacteria group bacterium]
MKIIKILTAIVLMALGVKMVMFGEMDDSPGAQMIGLLMVVAGIYVIIKTVRKKLPAPQK